MQHVNDFLTCALRCSYMFRNLHLQGQTMQFLQSENHDNHYHHLCNVTFPRPDCRVDIFRCKTNIWVAVCIADAVQTASLFPRSEARPALNTASILRVFIWFCAWICCEYDNTFAKLSFLLWIWRHSDSSTDGSCFSQWILPINRSLRYWQRYSWL